MIRSAKKNGVVCAYTSLVHRSSISFPQDTRHLHFKQSHHRTFLAVTPVLFFRHRNVPASDSFRLTSWITRSLCPRRGASGIAPRPKPPSRPARRCARRISSRALMTGPASRRATPRSFRVMISPPLASRTIMRLSPLEAGNDDTVALGGARW